MQEVEIQKDAVCLMEDIDEENSTNQLNKLTKCLSLLKRIKAILLKCVEKLSFNEIEKFPVLQEITQNKTI